MIRHVPTLTAALLASCVALAACGADGEARLDEPTTPAPTSSTAPPDDDATSPASTSTTSSADDARAPTAASTTTEPRASTPTTTSADTTETTLPRDCVDDLDLRTAAALLVWPAAEPSRWDEVVEAVSDHDVGGVILMRTGDWDEREVAERLADLEAASRHGLVIATDEEGGDVQRLRLLGDLPSQRQVSLDLGDDLDAVRRLVADHGRQVRAVGVDLVFGPVVDVEPIVGEVPLAPSRFFVGEPGDVTRLARAYVAGWRDADLVPTLKHFPGHGAASGDTHDVDGVTPDLAELRRRDLVPYLELGEQADADDLAVMVGHLTVPGLTDGLPATRSRAATELLRSQPGYDDALLVTDALGMAAVGLAEPEAAVAALAAGIDVALFTQTSQTGPVVDAIVEAVERGELDDATVRTSAARVMDVLARDGHSCDRPAD